MINHPISFVMLYGPL